MANLSKTAQNVVNNIALQDPANIPSTTTTTTTINTGRAFTSELIPFARRIWIIVTATNLRPSLDWYAVTFNNIRMDELDIEIAFSNFIDSKGINVGLIENWDKYKGSTIFNAELNQNVQFVKTDAAGTAKFALLVPEGVHIGDSIIELENEASIYAGLGGKSSRANAVYRAFGLLETSNPTIITTQTVDTRDSTNPPPPPQTPPVRPPTTLTPPTCGQRITLAQLEAYGGVTEIENRYSTATYIMSAKPDLASTDYFVWCRTREGTDPLAQSFTTFNESRLVSSIDLFFKTKGVTAPITLQLRETINGYPGPRIIPGSTITVLPENINISSDGSVVTEFNFTDPVYLEANTMYCFVIITYTTEYEVWTSELGSIDIISGNRIDKQPVLGSLFTSQNNVTWTAEQNFDIKFRINVCNFNFDGTNEYINFAPMTGASAYTYIQKTSQLILGNNQIIHPNTDIRWYYKFDRTDDGPSGTSRGLTSEYKLFQPGVNLDLENLTSLVLLRLEFSGGILSPIINKERSGFVFLRNLTEGVYITKTMDFKDVMPLSNLQPNNVRGLFNYKTPSNTSITVYMAVNTDLNNSNDILWRKVVTINNSGGTIDSDSTTFVSDAAGDNLVLAEAIGFYTGQAVTFSGMTGSPELTGTKYVRQTTDKVLKVYNSEANAIAGTSPLNITAGSGTINRDSFVRYTETVQSDGYIEALFDFDFSGILPNQQTDGINQFKYKMVLNVDEGYESKTPLVTSLRLIPLRK